MIISYNCLVSRTNFEFEMCKLFFNKLIEGIPNKIIQQKDKKNTLKNVIYGTYF